MGTPEENNRQHLEAFVARARRVEAHSLAQDLQELRGLARGGMQFVSRPDGSMVMRRDFPSEEVMESAAARVRPLMLNDEDCYFIKSLNALGYFIRDDAAITDLIKIRKREWNERVRESDDEIETGYRVLVENTSTGQQGALNHRKLARAWIYGDVVHHDRKRREGSELFGLRERFAAAVPLVAYLMVISIDLLDLIRALHKQGRLKVDDALLTTPAVLTSTVIDLEVERYTAPVGTPGPTTATGDLTGWTRITPPQPHPRGDDERRADG